jgi:hypothetical protein
MTPFCKTPDGQMVRTSALADEFRRFEGRLPLPVLCRAMGWPPHAIPLAREICDEFGIETPDRDPIAKRLFSGERPFEKKEDADLRKERAVQLANSQRLREIEWAKQEAATGTVAPYNPPAHLLWGNK